MTTLMFGLIALAIVLLTTYSDRTSG